MQLVSFNEEGDDLYASENENPAFFEQKEDLEGEGFYSVEKITPEPTEEEFLQARQRLNIAIQERQRLSIPYSNVFEDIKQDGIATKVTGTFFFTNCRLKFLM